MRLTGLGVLQSRMLESPVQWQITSEIAKSPNEITKSPNQKSLMAKP
jgi:hypothetical protein